ncbi:hypothetical protein MTO96_021665 [Rhipicephalus appendiculatus]
MRTCPPLPLHDEKIILRPHGGLCLDKWTRPELANAHWRAAGSTTDDRQNIIFRLRPQQNLAVISTPQSHVADALYKVRELRLGQWVYPITTYFAAPDNSCKDIVPGLVPGTPSSTLVDELLVPGTQTLQARMMGQTNVALVTFEGLKVPRYVRFYGAELRCYPPSPPANWFARYATSWAIGLTTVLRHTWSFVQHAGLTTPPRRIHAPLTAGPAKEPTLQQIQTAHGELPDTEQGLGT